MAYSPVRLVTVSRLFALTVTGSALLFRALMANFLLLALWIMFVYSIFSLVFENIGLNHARPRILLNLILEIRNRSYVVMTTL